MLENLAGLTSIRADGSAGRHGPGCAMPWSWWWFRMGQDGSAKSAKSWLPDRTRLRIWIFGMRRITPRRWRRQ